MEQCIELRNRLKATFRVKLNGKTVAIETVGQAYDFISQPQHGRMDGVQVAAQRRQGRA